MRRGSADPFEAVLEFHRRFGVPIGERPGFPSEEVVALRRRLIGEELAELDEALAARDLVEVADALADLLYVVYGTAISFGVDIRPVFDEVHRTNLRKVGGTTREDGKILKPDGWEAPAIERILAAMGSLAREEPEDSSPSR